MEHSVSELGSIVVAALLATNYQEPTFTNYQMSITGLAKYIDTHGGASTPDLGSRPTGPND